MFQDPATELRTTHQGPLDPSNEGNFYGFRVAFIIPEPSAVVLIGTGLAAMLWRKRRFRS